jgi:hypothetical protein
MSERASPGEATSVHDAPQDRIACRPIGQAGNRRDRRHLGGTPGETALTPLRELSEALLEVADRLASRPERD